MAIQVRCPSCRAVLGVEEKYAGMQVRCSGCQTVLQLPALPVRPPAPAPPPVPAPAAKSPPARGPASPAPPAPRRKASAAAPKPKAAPTPRLQVPPSKRGQLPPELVRRAEEVLENGEKVVWGDQPWDVITEREAWVYKIVGIAVMVFFLGVGVALPFIPEVNWFVLLIGGGVLGVFVLGGACCLIFGPAYVRKQAREVGYFITNRRALVVHQSPKKEVESFYAERLQFMKRVDHARARGGGSLEMGYHTEVEFMQGGPNSTGREVHRQVAHGFLGIANVAAVEAFLQQYVIQPGLARGSQPAPAPAPAAAAGKVGTAAAPAKPSGAYELPAALAGWQVPDAFAERVSACLKSGEKVLWAGKPSVLLVVLRALLRPAGALILGTCLLLNLFTMPDPISRAYPEVMNRWFGSLCLGYVALATCLGLPWRLLGLRKFCYVVTNRRALTWGPGWFFTTRATEYDPYTLSGLSRRRSWLMGQGAGDLVFAQSSGRDRHTGKRWVSRSGFMNVVHAPELEELINVVLVKPYTQGGTALDKPASLLWRAWYVMQKMTQ